MPYALVSLNSLIFNIMNIIFNTGRAYTDRGQRIAARVVGHDANGDAVVAVVDVDRGIRGVYITLLTAQPTRHDVMGAYDSDYTAGLELRDALDIAYGDPIFTELATAAHSI